MKFREQIWDRLYLELTKIIRIMLKLSLISEVIFEQVGPLF